jgi:cytidylate kinase
MEQQNNMIITITREFGSGGRTIAKKLAEELGYEYYDYEIVQEIAKESGFETGFVEKNSEDATSTSMFGFAWNNYGSSLSDKVYITQSNIITDLADSGKNCIIVGRCSDYILANHKDTFHVFIHADFEFRKNRVVSVYGENEYAPDKRVKEKDKKRIAYYKYYTDRKWGDAYNYQMCLDSGKLGVDACVKLIKEAVKNEE